MILFLLAGILAVMILAVGLSILGSILQGAVFIVVIAVHMFAAVVRVLVALVTWAFARPDEPKKGPPR